MQSSSPRGDRPVDRRTFLKRGLLVGGLLAGAGLGVGELSEATSDPDSPRTSSPPQPAPQAGRPNAPTPPNILVILVDQLRFPQWFRPQWFPTGWLSGADPGLGLTTNLQNLRRGAVCFSRHYTAANDCTPSRAALLTGLYTHQTGCMITGGSTLDPGFPTWGTMLRERGYHTRWYGKWHLTHHDNWWGPASGEAALERYGFAGGTYPSPDGAPGQGWRKDPQIAAQFAEWFAAEGGREPWCTTVSFVNPHDIAWWYRWSERVASEASAPTVAQALPPNYETPEMLIERNKPRLQRSLQDTAAASFGPVPFTGPDSLASWLDFLNLYVKLQREVDASVGQVLDALHTRPEVEANTVIVFSSDHGEYGASHGLRGKGAAAYEEGIRVPLIVKDPRGVLTSAPERVRNQLTSSVDIAPLLLTIATGSSDWRREEHHAHLAKRLDLAAMLADPRAPGRPYVLHATDEIVTEYAIEPYAADAPLHVVAMRTPTAKYATYSHWPAHGVEPTSQGEEVELYDYSTPSGRLELENGAGQSALEETLRSELQQAYGEELRAPLPARLAAAQERGFADYFQNAKRAAWAATARRKKRSERKVGRALDDARRPGRPGGRPGRQRRAGAERGATGLERAKGGAPGGRGRGDRPLKGEGQKTAAASGEASGPGNP